MSASCIGVNLGVSLLQVKGKLGGLIIGAAYVFMFATVRIFPFALDWLGIEGIFFIFSATSLAGVIFIYIFLPETFGKSLDEIERQFCDDGER